MSPGSSPHRAGSSAALTPPTASHTGSQDMPVDSPARATTSLHELAQERRGTAKARDGRERLGVARSVHINFHSDRHFQGK
jgi:hypothetical protein